MNFSDRINNLDRRWLYLLVGVFAVLPLLYPLNMPVNISPAVQALYDRVESLEPGEIIMRRLYLHSATVPEVTISFNVSGEMRANGMRSG